MVAPQVFHATDADLEALALKAMRAFLATLYPDIVKEEEGDTEMNGVEPDAAQFSGIAERMCRSCLDELAEPDKTNASAASKILGIAVSSSRAFVTHLFLAYFLG